MNKSFKSLQSRRQKSRNGIDAKTSVLHSTQKLVLKEIIPSNRMRDEFPTNVTFKLSNYL